MKPKAVKFEALVIKGLHLSASFMLVLAVLISNLGTEMVLTSQDQIDGETGVALGLSGPRLVHLQLFGGLIHIHEGADEAHFNLFTKVDTLDTLKTVPTAHPENLAPPSTNLYYSTFNTVVNGAENSSLFLNVSGPKIQPLAKDFAPQLFSVSPVSRYNQANLPDPFIAVPLRPPIN